MLWQSSRCSTRPRASGAISFGRCPFLLTVSQVPPVIPSADAVHPLRIAFQNDMRLLKSFSHRRVIYCSSRALPRQWGLERYFSMQSRGL
jgi:hypothetical protein